MQLNTLTRKTARKTGKRVGRGGKRGKTSGRGTKGQKARAGHRIRPEARDMIKKLPKLRGRGKNINTSVQAKPIPVNIKLLEQVFVAGDTVTPKVLIERGAVSVRKGSLPKMKLLGTGELTKKLTVSGFTVSASAKEKIEKAGGSIA